MLRREAHSQRGGTQGSPTSPLLLGSGNADGYLPHAGQSPAPAADVRLSETASMSGAKREHVQVLATEAVGPYTFLRLDRGELEPGTPGQFFMLEAPGRLLPRPMSVCLAPPGELGFLIDPIGPGTRALCGLAPGDRLGVLGPLGKGFRLDVERPLLVGGGIGVAPFPYLSEMLGAPSALLGFRSSWHAEAAALVPNAEVVLEPTYVTELMPAGHDVLACGPEPMLEAVRRLTRHAQLAWEAPMACGYGACYGCAVEIDGVLRRLCVEGPVLETA